MRIPPAPDKLTSSDFPVLWPVGTRWADNDMFGHLNNAVYYQLFDTAINAWINTSTGLDPLTMPALGIVAESGCRYFSELHFPQSLLVGLAVTRLGRSSVTYRLGVFRVEARAPKSRSRSPRSGTGCTFTSTGPAASRFRFPTPSGHCCRRPASSESALELGRDSALRCGLRVPVMLRQCQF